MSTSRGSLLRTRWAGIGVAALATVCVLTACKDGPSDPQDLPLNGSEAQVNQLEVKDLMLVAFDEGEPARFLGSLVNQGEEPLEVSIADEDDEVSLVLPAGAAFDFADHPTLFETADVKPGTIMTVIMTVASDDEVLELPVIQSLADLTQTDAPISPGNSSDAAVNTDG